MNNCMGKADKIKTIKQEVEIIDTDDDDTDDDYGFSSKKTN